MPDKPFVINDRRKFTAEGDLRDDSPRSQTTDSAETGRSTDEPDPSGSSTRKEPIAFPVSAPKVPAPEPGRSEDEPEEDDGPLPAARSAEPIAFPGSSAGTAAQENAGTDDAAAESLPPLTAEQSEQANRAYTATVDRLDTALRANNLGSEPLPQMTFERVVQSLYMQALLQLGGATEPGQPPQVDILGARQTIDMLAIIAEKSRGNLSETEDKLLQSALFEIRMGFLEVTQALARQAAARVPPGAGAGPLAGPGIVR